MPPAPNRLMTTAPSSGTRFRPCLDLHDGQVKQIVGGTLSDDRRELQTNFVSPHPPRYFVEKYRTDDLRGGHVIMLGPDNETAAREALAAWPGGLQLGGGITETTAATWLEAGASHVINSKTENLHERLLSLTDGHGPDVAIEAVGNPATFTAAVDEVCFAGRVVYIGYAKAPVSYETKYFVMKELDIMGSRNSTPTDFRDVISMLESGRYPIAETVTRTVPFAEAGQALADWSANPGAITKIHVEL